MSEPTKCPECGNAFVRISDESLVCPRCLAVETMNLAEELSALRAENAKIIEERDAWREVIATLCGDGGHYHVQHGTEKTKEYVLKRFYGLLAESERLKAIVEKLPVYIGTGEPVPPGASAYWLGEFGGINIMTVGIARDDADIDDIALYSTREAAEAAKEKDRDDGTGEGIAR